MISYDEMPDDNEELKNIDIDFPHVSLTEISKPEEIEPQLLEYLELEEYVPDGELKFIRTAKVENTVYWIWEFESAGEKIYATASQDENGNTSIGCDEDYYGLTPEQFILGDYHDCF